jgi:tetratricopeptide (TPR) repeat protein
MAAKPHNASEAQLKKLLWLLVPVTGLAFFLGSAPLLVLGGVVWIFWLVYYVLITRLFQPTGDSTPAPKWHSNIEAMVAHGDYAKAAEAFKAEIAADPEDVGACEKLGQLAVRELKDYQLAIWAYREAERRVPEPNRKFAEGLILAGIYRDQLADLPRTVVELSRLLAQYPDAPNAAALRTELEELRSHLFEGTAP